VMAARRSSELSFTCNRLESDCNGQVV
jgi:hypothetical protein